MDENHSCSLAGHVSKSVQHLLNEFNSLYEEKLRRLECEIKRGSPEESLRIKAQILRSYVNDLCDQNQILVQTVEDLEKEAFEKIAGLELKLRASGETIYDLDHQRSCLEEDNMRLRADLQELKADTSTLAQVTGVNLRTVRLERIADHSAYSAQSLQKPGDLMKAQVEDLRNQLKAKNGIIQSLREEIKTLLFHSAQKKNELLERREAMLLLRKLELETAQITSTDVTGGAHARLWVEHREAAASDGEGRRAVEVLDKGGNSKAERAHKLQEQVRKQERIVDRVVNSRIQNEVEVSNLTSRVKQLQLLQAKARNSSTHSISQDPREQKPRGPDNNGAHEEDRTVLRDPSAGLLWNLNRQQERLFQSHKRLSLKREQVNRKEEKARAAHPKLEEGEERMRRLQLDPASPHAVQKCLRKPAAVKKQHTSQERSHTLQSLQSQLQTSKEKVNSLGLEVGLLKSKLQEKTEQSQQLQDQILKQQEALSRASATLKDTRRAAGNKIHKRENKLSVAQKQLQEAKKQLTDCKKECLERQKELEKLQEQSEGLTGQVKEHSQELLRLGSEKRKLELELAVITEKHRATQQEVADRDQVILQLRMELTVSEEKHQGAQKELVLQEAEVSRLNERVRRQQDRLQELSETCRQGDTQLDQKERDRQLLQSQLQLAQQQLKHQAKQMERMKGELATSGQCFAADTERWNQRNLLLQKQLQQVQEQNVQHTQILPKLRDNLNQSQRALQLSQEKIKEYEEILKKRDGEMTLVKQQLEEVQTELSEIRTSVQSHQSAADIFKQKYTAAMAKVQQLQAQSQRMEEDAQLSVKQVEEARAEVSSLRDEMSSLQCRYKMKVSQMEHWEKAVEQLTEELQAALDSLRTREERGLWCEKEMERLRVKVDGQQKQISDYDGKCLRLQTDFTSYQGAHSHSNEEFEVLHKQFGLCQQALQQSEDEMALVKTELQNMQLALRSTSEEVQELREEVQKMLKDEKQKEEENQATRNHIKLFKEQLQQLLSLYTDADSVAGQKEGAVLLPSSQGTTEEQLSEQAEKLGSYQLSHLQDILQKIQTKASISQVSLRKALDDATEQQRQSCKSTAEREEAREQMRQQGALVCKLTEELEKEHGHYEEQQHQLSKLKVHMADMEVELDGLRIKNRNDAVLVRIYEERVLQLSQQMPEDQRKWQESPDEHLLLLKREQTALQDKYARSVQELQKVSQALEEALTDNTHLQEERSQLVTNISRWITDHKAASESLAGRIKEQNKLLATISREKEHLQESRDFSEEELRRLRIQVEEREQEIQQLKAVHSYSANQRALVNQLRGRSEVEENVCKNPLAKNQSRMEEMQSRLRSDECPSSC
ncbi:uncharacterized protein [Salminus brasiliensis]|uniref:uncharacterized protein n=1 Tax=Salminus brasiliensis TaxID=930266 RepID=UPI003B82D910